MCESTVNLIKIYLLLGGEADNEGRMEFLPPKIINNYSSVTCGKFSAKMIAKLISETRTMAAIVQKLNFA